ERAAGEEKNSDRPFRAAIAARTLVSQRGLALWRELANQPGDAVAGDLGRVQIVTGVVQRSLFSRKRGGVKFSRSGRRNKLVMGRELKEYRGRRELRHEVHRIKRCDLRAVGGQVFRL